MLRIVAWVCWGALAILAVYGLKETTGWVQRIEIIGFTLTVLYAILTWESPRND